MDLNRRETFLTDYIRNPYCGIFHIHQSLRHSLSPFLILHLLHVLLHPGDEPSLLCLVNDAFSGAAQVLDEGGEGDPAGGVHVEVLLISDVLLVDHVGVDSLPRVLPLQDVAVALNNYIVRFGTNT